MIINEEDYLAHYGTLRKSGRYPWGSGEDQNTRNKMFLDYVNDLKKQGLTDAEIGRGVGLTEHDRMSSKEIRELKTIANNELKQAKITQVRRLADTGMSNIAIGKEMGLNESSVRALRASGDKEKADIFRNTSDMLKEEVSKKGMIDVGAGVENHLGVSVNTLSTALTILREQGYEVHTFTTPQLGTGKDTILKVLVPPGVTQKQAWANRAETKQISNFSDDGGRTFLGMHPPLSIHSDRVAIKYGEEGGSQADGVLYVRPGVKDVSLGGVNYAQVRVKVGDTHYIKGVAMYKNDLPEGTDILFHTSKSNTGDKTDALKPLLPDPDNPFGTVFKHQILEKDKEGNDHVTSAMNIVYEEGDWFKWQRSIASQVLSKQSPALAKSQLDMTFENKKDEFDAISNLTNPTVRKRLLKEFSASADASAAHLEAAALPRTAWHAILPITSLKPTDVYAPNYRNGETVALIRYPHGGTFEIPELRVNNKHVESRRLLGDAIDVIGIHPSVAQRLSGADFDGDTVLVIPNNSRRIQSTPALEGLKDFDHRLTYPGYPGMKVMSNTQAEMGAISNLITDMTIRGASTSDLARAVRHSMVVIDAEKHELNYKQSAIDNGIKQLKQKYQSQPGGGTGASTLISRAGSRVYVLDRKDRRASLGGPIDPVTGQKVFEPTNKRDYKTSQLRQIRSKALVEATDAHTLSSGTPIERLYADHSNRLKHMANQARLEELKTPRLKYDSGANKVYATQVKSLNEKLALAKYNQPLERQAQLVAASIYKAKINSNPNMDDKMKKKIKFQALEAARNRFGAKKQKIEIDQEEWNAIQAGAISDSRLSSILDNADMKVVRKLATPREDLKMTTSKTSRAHQMLASGYTRSEVADALGVSLTTLDVATKES